MTGNRPLGSLTSPPADDVVAVATACRGRLMEREGIAMFVALEDARPGRRLRVHDGPTLAEGALLARLFAHYEAGMAAGTGEPHLVSGGLEGMDSDPTGAVQVIDVLVVLADQHLRARP